MLTGAILQTQVIEQRMWQLKDVLAAELAQKDAQLCQLEQKVAAAQTSPSKESEAEIDLRVALAEKEKALDELHTQLGAQSTLKDEQQQHLNEALDAVVDRDRQLQELTVIMRQQTEQLRVNRNSSPASSPAKVTGGFCVCDLQICGVSEWLHMQLPEALQQADAALGSPAAQSQEPHLLDTHSHWLATMSQRHGKLISDGSFWRLTGENGSSSIEPFEEQ
jgi:hypothetical protein